MLGTLQGRRGSGIWIRLEQDWILSSETRGKMRAERDGFIDTAEVQAMIFFSLNEPGV